jgi:integrase
LKLQRGLSTDSIQTLYAELAKKQATKRSDAKLSARSRLHVHRVLSQCLEAAVRHDKIASNPAKRATPPRKKSDDTGSTEVMHILEIDDMHRLLKTLEGSSLYLISWVAAATGARRGEILALRWRDVDLEGAAIRIQHALEFSNEFGLRVKAPKNKSSIRTIPVDEETIAKLRAHRADFIDAASKMEAVFDRDWFVFPHCMTKPDQARLPSSVSSMFRVRATAAGFPDFRFHDWRHTHASLQLAAGTPVPSVARRLGHASPAITMNVYAHAMRQSEDKAVATASAFMRASAPALPAPKGNAIEGAAVLVSAE